MPKFAEILQRRPTAVKATMKTINCEFFFSVYEEDTACFLIDYLNRILALLGDSDVRLAMKGENHKADISIVDSVHGIRRAQGVVVYFSGELAIHNPKLMDYSIVLTSSSSSRSYQSIKPLLYPSCLFPIESLTRKNGEHTRFCAFVCRHEVDFRTAFVQELQRYKRVDCPGVCLNNMEAIGKRWQDKIDFISQYKFVVAFENYVHPGYTTEKIIDALIAGCVPIYYGDPNVTQRINPQAFINVSDFPTVNAAIAHIAEVDKDAQLYARYRNAEPYHQDSILHNDTDENLALFCKSVFSQVAAIRPRNTYYIRLYRLVYHAATLARRFAAINGGQDRFAMNCVGFPMHRYLSHWRVWLVGIPKMLYKILYR